jgi:hypothetical protein
VFPLPNSIIDAYASQRFGWRRRVSTKDNGAAVYNPARPADPQIASGRVDQKKSLVTNEKGEKVLSVSLVLTAEAIEPGDIIVWDSREWPVIARKIIYGLTTGNELYREVYI